MSSPKNAPSGARLALVALLCAAWPAHAADETNLRPVLNVEQSWDSNIYNDSEDDQGSLITTISPGLWLENVGELGHARLGLSARARNVWEESDLSGIDVLLRGSLQRKLTPRLTLLGDGLLDHYSGYEEISEGNSGLPGEILTGEQPSWKRDQLGGGFSYLLTERLSLTLKGYAGRVNYESVDASVTSQGSYSDRTLLGGNTTLIYQLTALDQVMLDVALDDTEYEDLGAGTNDTGIWSSEIGWTRNWTQFFSSTAKIGFSVTDTTQKNVPQFGTCLLAGTPIPCSAGDVRASLGQADFSTSGTALIGELSLRRVFARGALELSYDRSTRSTGGSGRRNFDIDSYALSWTQRLAERVRLSVTGLYSAQHAVSDEIPAYAPDLVRGCSLGGSLVLVGTIPPFTNVVQCVGGSSEEKRVFTTLVGRLEWQLRRRLSSYVVATYRHSITDEELGNFGEVRTEDLDKFIIGAGFRYQYDLGL